MTTGGRTPPAGTRPTASDADDWFRPPQTLADRERQDRRRCAGCPVREACLDYALTARQPWGVSTTRYLFVRLAGVCLTRRHFADKR